MNQETLYDRLGDVHLQALVDSFYDIVLEDTRINSLFQSDMTVVRDKQFKFLTQFLGGPARYADEYGHPRMRQRHMPHKITADAAYAWLECMSQAIATLPIDDDLKRELLGRFPHVAAHMVNAQ